MRKLTEKMNRFAIASSVSYIAEVNYLDIDLINTMFYKIMNAAEDLYTIIELEEKVILMVEQAERGRGVHREYPFTIRAVTRG